MSKRTTNAKFRTVDVDQYNEDNFEDALLDGDSAGPDASGDGYLAVSDAELSKLLADNKISEALAALLAKPPVNVKSSAVKDQAANQVLRVLMHTKQSDIDRVVQALDEAHVDTLMKYVYRCFELVKENHALLLVWHEKVLARGQIGSIVRALSDRKRV
uniref:Actin-related protein 2/3 complex subunit 5 n=2 Tax=Macrostomum lignano TaxID=282301 RepID=A0A1I8HYS3_9PLAT